MFEKKNNLFKIPYSMGFFPFLVILFLLDWGMVNEIIHTVYILYSALHNKIYIGETSNLIQRFYSHNDYGNEWTKRFRPWKVIYCEHFEQRSKALKREKELKGGKGREWIWKKIHHEFTISGFISA